MLGHKMKTYAFVGPSGTGKSYRAQMVAQSRNIKFIIDDGLLISENQVVAGQSAKKAPTKVETVRNALFLDEAKKKEVQKAIKKYKPDSILILGTSDKMVSEIASNLGFEKISETIYIEDVATEDEMATARNIRKTQGKHVIPVPTFDIKKQFSGYLLDPLQIFKSTGKGNAPYIDEKSIVRPTFSYLGNFTISDTVFKQIVTYIAKKNKNVYSVPRITIYKHKGYNYGIFMAIGIIINYGVNAMEAANKFKSQVKKEIENLTAMNVLKIDIVVKGVNFKEEKK